MYANTTGARNVAIGNAAGFNNQTGNNNIFIGFFAGATEFGSDNLYIANNATTPLLRGKMSATAADNKLGIGTDILPFFAAINVWNGAQLSTGGVWMNASSREFKQDIETLQTEDALAALEGLSPVRYVYKNSGDEEHVGFIAEDVPELVASIDRKSLSPMDIVAVLTTVTKAQEAQIAGQSAKLAEKEAALAELQDRVLHMEMALTEIMRHQEAGVQVSLSH